MKTRLTLSAILVSCVLNAQNPVRIKLNQWVTGITRVTDIANCGDSRIFVTQQSGIIKIITDSNTVLGTPFLNLQSVVNDAQNEQGLLGLAFDPNYATNGAFYTHYTGGTGNGMSVISRWYVSTGDPNIADPASEEILYTYPQPAWNHNGGDIEFGPDGYLYITFGDGGGGDDTYDNGGDYSDPLAGIIRIDVSDTTVAYTIPTTNPYATSSGPDTLPEIWAEGLRNPYRIGFDQLTGDLWIGDVGQNAWEETDFWPAGDNSGPNFGWHCREGFVACPGCATGGCPGVGAFVQPVVVHENIATGGSWCSSIGGRVYRGALWPHLSGLYVYTDYCGGEFRSLEPNGGGWTDKQLATSITGFSVIAENSDGELFAGNNDNGRVYKIVDKCPMDPPSISFTADTLHSTSANSYTWYVDGSSIPGSNNANWVPVVAGNYWVVGDFGSGCTLNSDTLFVTPDGVADFVLPELLIAPNPANEQVLISWNSAQRVVELRVVDATGREVSRADVSGTWSRTIDLTPCNAGAYLAELRDAQGTVLGSGRFSVVR